MSKILTQSGVHVIANANSMESLSCDNKLVWNKLWIYPSPGVSKNAGSGTAVGNLLPNLSSVFVGEVTASERATPDQLQVGDAPIKYELPQGRNEIAPGRDRARCHRGRRRVVQILARMNMKKLHAFLLTLFFVANVTAQERTAQPATQAEVSAGIVGNKYISPKTASAGAGALRRISTGSGNEYDDMRAFSNAGPNVVLGYSYTGSTPEYVDLWASKNTGLGSNAFGAPINLPGGATYIGNPYWQDLPQSLYRSQGFYFGFGPAFSALQSAWPNGTNSASSQPYFQVVNANPWGGGAAVNVRSGFTNVLHGVLQGSDSNGVPIYVSQFGFQMLELSDAYGIRSNGILTNLGREAQQAPGHVLLNSDALIDFIFRSTVSGAAMFSTVRCRCWPLPRATGLTVLSTPVFRSRCRTYG